MVSSKMVIRAIHMYFGATVVSALHMRGSGTKENEVSNHCLVLIDLLQGYDPEYLRSAGVSEKPGGLKYVTRAHDPSSKPLYVFDSNGEHPEIDANGKFWKVSRQERNKHWSQVNKNEVSFTKERSEFSYDFGWNKGINGFKKVATEALDELNTGRYNCVVVVGDWLSKSGWKNDAVGNTEDGRPVYRQIPRSEYNAITAGSDGAELSSVIRAKYPGLSTLKDANDSDSIQVEVKLPDGATTKQTVQVLYHRKNVDDAFKLDKSAVDLNEDGSVNDNAVFLKDKLARAGKIPENTELTFVGVVTDRCVKSSLLSAFKQGFKTRVAGRGVGAADETKHKEGLAAIEKGMEDSLDQHRAAIAAIAAS